MLSKGNLWRRNKNILYKTISSSREMVHHETNLNLSDDENEEIDHENQSKIQHSDSDTENDDDELNRTVS
jgi:hypothetical protein